MGVFGLHDREPCMPPGFPLRSHLYMRKRTDCKAFCLSASRSLFRFVPVATLSKSRSWSSLWKSRSTWGCGWGGGRSEAAGVSPQGGTPILVGPGRQATGSKKRSPNTTPEKLGDSACPVTQRGRRKTITLKKPENYHYHPKKGTNNILTTRPHEGGGGGGGLR